MNIVHSCCASSRAAAVWSFAALFVGVAGSSTWADVSEADAEQGIIECTADLLKKNNPDLAGKPDRLICFQAYVSNFNTQPRQMGGKQRFLGVPHWIAHHIEKAPNSPE